MQQKQGVYQTQGGVPTQLEIRLKNGELTLLPGDVEAPVIRYWINDASGQEKLDAMITEERQSNKLRLTLGEGWLGDMLKKNFKQRILGDSWHQLRYEVQLPRQMYEQLALEIDGGEASISGMTAQEMTVRLNAGRLQLKDSTAKSIGLGMQSGSLTVNGVQAEILTGRISSGKAEFENIRAKQEIAMHSGSLSLELNELSQDVSLSSQSGRLKINLGRVTTPYLLDVKMSSGAVDIDLPGAKYKSGGTNHFSKNIGGEGGPAVRIEASSGKVDIE